MVITNDLKMRLIKNSVIVLIVLYRTYLDMAVLCKVILSISSFPDSLSLLLSPDRNTQQIWMYSYAT